MEECSPLFKAIKYGLISAKENHDTARGAMYEIEVALILQQNGQSIKSLGQKFKSFIPTRNSTYRVEADIITDSKFIECKNIYWDKVKDIKTEIEKLQNQISKAYIVATESENKVYEIYSKYKIPDQLKKWLVKKNIKFYEGY